MIKQLGTLGAIALLAACDGYFGAEREVPLPGERIPVMLLEEDVEVDPRIADIRVTLPDPWVNTAWPQAGGNASHAMHHLALPDSINLDWRTSIGRGSSGSSKLLSEPIVAAGRVFTVDADGDIRAFTTTDGKRQWSYEPDSLEDSDRLRGGGLAFDDGRLYATTTIGEVLALNPDDGSELWRQPLLAPSRGAPTFIDGKVLAITADNQLFALDAQTGDVLWRHAGLFEQAAILGGAAPASTDGVVITPYSSGEVFALRSDSGATIWSDTVIRPRRTLAISAITDINGSPIIDRDRVIVAGNGGEMASLDIRRGTRVWDADLTSIETPWVAGDYIFLVTERSEVVCLLRQGGLIRWVTALRYLEDPEDPDTDRIRWTRPILASDRLILASSEGEIVSISPYTGEVLGTTRAPAPVAVAPIVANNTLYILTENGDLLAYR